VARSERGVWCEAGPFAFAAALASASEGEVSVGIRPEAIRLSTLASGWAGELRHPATVLLREDLGGEEILYLDVEGTPLTTVVRHDAGEDPGAERLSVTVDPRDLVLFAADGSRIGQGTSAHG
jgi:ABC-type sugar transport system ATPase subunit